MTIMRYAIPVTLTVASLCAMMSASAESGQSFLVDAGISIFIRPWSAVNDAVYRLQPAEPVSLPPPANDAVIDVRGRGLATALPFRKAVTSHSPSALASR